MRGRDKAVQGYVEYGTCLRCEMLCSTVHSGTVHCSTVRCSAADYSTVQCSTALSTAALQWTLSGEPHSTIRPPPPSRIGRETLPDTALRCTMLYLTHLLTGLDWSWGLRVGYYPSLCLQAVLYCTVLWCTCAVIYRAALLACQTVSPSVRLFPLFTLYTSDVTGRSGLFGSNQRTFDLRSWTLDLDSWRCPLVLWVRRGGRNGLTSETA